MTTAASESDRERRGVALCLSGGGYRAALFHLGAARRLNELGVLGQVDTFTSVSGGSIFAAFLALYFRSRAAAGAQPAATLPDWEAGVAAPLRAFTRTNIRSRAILLRLHPRNLVSWNLRLETLAQQYAKGISPIRFNELPQGPRFVFCATDMEFGQQWVLDSGLRRAGSDAAGYASPVPDSWTLARAVAASSSVPLAFPLLRAVADPADYIGGSYQGPDRPARLRKMVLTDGGLYDNLGLEPVWRDHRTVLVSDAAPTYATLQSASLAWRGLRNMIVLLEQATEVRKRWLISTFLRKELEGACWEIGRLPSRDTGPTAPAYSDALIARRIARVRIDLDRFTDGEIAVLENHGYIVADRAVQRHLPHLIRTPHPLAVPHETWMDEQRVERALASSDRTRFPGRGLFAFR